MGTYSFLDTVCALVGPGGFINLANGAGSAEEGITIEADAEIGSMTIGAGGEVMHSLHANKSGTVTVRLLKTSPVNSLLAAMYAFQTASAVNYGRNTITLSNVATGDSITCQSVGFKKIPSLTYAKDGGIIEWTFNAGVIDRLLGVTA